MNYLYFVKHFILRFKIGSYHFYFSKRQLLYYSLFVFLCYFIICLPNRLFYKPYATILLDEKGYLLNARIAEDGQWRFPDLDSVPHKFEKALITYEDKGFYEHWGVSIPSMFRATWQNIKNARVVSGGSTLTMQIARMAKGGKRTILNKLVETIHAYRLEFRYSKEELLKIYTMHAPFGGNVVGLEAASWRYFNLPPHQLSWAEAATLAVLPNAPSLIHFGRNRERLIEKRNALLQKLQENEVIDDFTLELAIEENLPEAPKRLPSLAPHLMDKFIKNGATGQRIQTSIDQDLQVRMTELGNNYQRQFDQKEIHNAAILIIDTKTNEVKSYIGNTANSVSSNHFVDIIQAPRSTGSILKPFLFAAMVQEGIINNEQLIPDIPMKFDDFSPKNFNNTFNGAVSAKKALARSLNIPAVYLLKKYGIGKFLHLMQKAGQKSINRSVDNYGLSLILGGAESSLWDITTLYNSMSKNLMDFNKDGKYSIESWFPPKIILNDVNWSTQVTSGNLFDAASIYLTFQALVDVNRPEDDVAWRHYSSSRPIAWKTGTSFGNRDAWAVGCTPDYTVGVWVGNATGEGRPDIVGGRIAAPIMLDVMSRLPIKQKWYEQPMVEMKQVEVCTQSGFLASEMCVEKTKIWAHKHIERGNSCNFHQRIITDSRGEYRYHKNCEPSDAVYQTKLVLPPLQSWYYRYSHADYTPIPPYHHSCENVYGGNKPAIIYPQHKAELLGVKDLDGNIGEFVFEAAHQNPDEILYWHLDNQFLGETETIHKISSIPEKGNHRLTVMDQSGNSVSINFKVVTER